MTFEEEFDKFLQVWCDNNYAHLCDTDENDGQKLREYVDKNYVLKSKVREAIERVAEKKLYREGWFVRELMEELEL
jgi:hypothetical protein